MTSATLMLEARLDLKTAAQTATAVMEHDGQDLTLDASQVTHFGALGVQVLRAAARTWSENGHALALVNASSDCVDQMVLLGYEPATITQWEDTE